MTRAKKKFNIKLTLLILVISILGGQLLAQDGLAQNGLVPVEINPLAAESTTLSIELSDGAILDLTIDELEEMETYSLQTKTPWREDVAQFVGVKLTDILQRAGFEGDIYVYAENDYVVLFSEELWRTAPFLLATRVDGRRISRRERGPLLLTIHSSYLEENGLVLEDHLVWMVNSISRAD